LGSIFPQLKVERDLIESKARPLILLTLDLNLPQVPKFLAQIQQFESQLFISILCILALVLDSISSEAYYMFGTKLCCERPGQVADSLFIIPARMCF